MESWNATTIKNLGAENETLLYNTFLSGIRFWIQRVLLPLVVAIGVLGNSKYQVFNVFNFSRYFFFLKFNHKLQENLE